MDTVSCLIDLHHTLGCLWIIFRINSNGTLKYHFLISFDRTPDGTGVFSRQTKYDLPLTETFVMYKYVYYIYRFGGLYLNRFSLVLHRSIRHTKKHWSNVKKWSSETKQIGTTVAIININAAVGQQIYILNQSTRVATQKYDTLWTVWLPPGPGTFIGFWHLLRDFGSAQLMTRVMERRAIAILICKTG